LRGSTSVALIASGTTSNPVTPCSTTSGVYYRTERVAHNEIVNGETKPTTRNKATLGGYVRAGGCLRVIGLINVSLTFYLRLEYDLETDVLYGSCEVIDEDGELSDTSEAPSLGAATPSQSTTPSSRFKR
jgi:hypothetical protein